MFSLTACATKGALRRGLDEQRVSIENERIARLAADSAQRVDTQREIAMLRSDLQVLRTEFGAKIAEVAQGIQFAFPVHFGFNEHVEQSFLLAL